MGVLIKIMAFILIAVGGYRIFLKLRQRRCKSQVCLLGKTAIVTGANCGIGYVTAADFARRGARVILACRNQSRAEEARAKIIQETGNENVVVKIVNLGSPDSVRAFAEDVNATEERLDILVNNAGACGRVDEKGIVGTPLLLQVNYFSNVLLTLLLIDLLKKTGSSRIVNVSSLMASFATKLNVDDLDKPVPDQDYNNSKLCNILFTIELAKKLRGTSVTAYSLHPGFVASEFFRNLSGFSKFVNDIFVQLFSITCEEGAQTSLHCALAEGIEVHSGEHFEKCQRVGRPETAKDPSLARNVWKKTMEVICLKESEDPFRRVS